MMIRACAFHALEDFDEPVLVVDFEETRMVSIFEICDDGFGFGGSVSLFWILDLFVVADVGLMAVTVTVATPSSEPRTRPHSSCHDCC